jgi:hypothetical protein
LAQSLLRKRERDRIYAKARYERKEADEGGVEQGTFGEEERLREDVKRQKLLRAREKSKLRYERLKAEKLAARATFLPANQQMNPHSSLWPNRFQQAPPMQYHHPFSYTPTTPSTSNSSSAVGHLPARDPIEERILSDLAELRERRLTISSLLSSPTATSSQPTPSPMTPNTITHNHTFTETSNTADVTKHHRRGVQRQFHSSKDVISILAEAADEVYNQ